MNPQKLLEKTDEELALLSLESQNAFAILLRRYQGRLLSFIMKISNFGLQESEDILQEVFIKVYKNLNYFDNNLKFSSWIYRITRNQTISHHRKKNTKSDSMVIDIDDEILNTLADNFDINKKLDHKILQKSISQALNKLENKYRDVLILRFFEDKDYREISDILEKPEGTVATLINRAKKKMKNYLTEI